MKVRTLIFILLIGIPLLLWSQSVPPQTPPAGTETQTGSGAAQGTGQPGTMHHGMHGMQGGDMQAMHAQHMQQMAQMKQQVAKMRSLLDQMRTSVTGMTGKDKAAMQANVELWQMMVDHMDQMVQHMSSMDMGGMGMEHGASGNTMHHHGTMQDNTPEPQTPPKQ